MTLNPEIIYMFLKTTMMSRVLLERSKANVDASLFQQQNQILLPLKVNVIIYQSTSHKK